MISAAVEHAGAFDIHCALVVSGVCLDEGRGPLMRQISLVVPVVVVLLIQHR
jgi:hypothetical protein